MNAPFFDELNELYQEILGRSIDTSGYITYSQMMIHEGAGVERIAEVLRDSAEHRNRADNTSTPSHSGRGRTAFAESPSGKLCIDSAVTVPEHRSGWTCVTDAMAPLHNSDGVLLDDFIEDRFARRLFAAVNAGEVPYRRPWVGFLHNPPNMPPWFEYDTSPQVILSRRDARESGILPRIVRVVGIRAELARRPGRRSRGGAGPSQSGTGASL